MFGLEVVAVAPFVVAMWRLAKKVGEQQNLIDAHEATINSQQEVLNALSGNAPSGVSSKVLAIGGAAAVAAVTLNYAVQLTATRRVGTVRPPESYEPTPALSENEECKICMGNKKTLCSCHVDTTPRAGRAPANFYTDRVRSVEKP
ncbi:hypothetical protein AGDE_09090 [Angomonas deanei]|nr:hypothetical protein AGDE_09090 [Angomonas deanei]|eukprot:EPY31362.1 hypothetical protein AGDE_09090 [Angomonas deanei]